MIDKHADTKSNTGFGSGKNAGPGSVASVDDFIAATIKKYLIKENITGICIDPASRIIKLDLTIKY